MEFIGGFFANSGMMGIPEKESARAGIMGGVVRICKFSTAAAIIPRVSTPWRCAINFSMRAPNGDMQSIGMGAQDGAVRERFEAEVRRIVGAAPSSKTPPMAWRIRTRVGDRVKWYKDVDEVK